MRFQEDKNKFIVDSIKIEENYVFCRFCGGIVYANQPTCKKCGLGMSSDGICDLAKIEEENTEALDHIYKLKQLSTIFLAMTVMGFLIALIPEFSFFFHIYFWVAISNVFLGFVGWNNKYSALNFNFEDIETIKQKKREILFLFFVNLILGLAFNIYLLS
ncbi:MAG TPA: hypothetical protein VGD05_09085 [Pyrinomonadaceae bacterium]